MRTFDLDQFWIDAAPLSAATGKRQAGSAAQLPVPAPTAIPASPYTLPAAQETAKPDYHFGSYAIAPEAFGTRAPKPSEPPPAGTRAIGLRGWLSNTSLVAWAGIGFFGGVIAWQASGLLASSATVAVNAPVVPRRVETVRIEQPALALQPTALPSAQSIFNLDPRVCMALALDRSTGSTRIERCPNDALPMRDAGRQRRGDLVARARVPEIENWSAATAVETAPAPAAPSAANGTLEPTDVDLQIKSSNVQVVKP